MAKVSLKTIAEETNLSLGTVSLVLNGRGDEMRISKKTQEIVISASRKLGYQVNIHARRLRQKSQKKQTTVIGVLWPSLYSSELLVRFFDGIQTAILKDNINVEIIYKPYTYSEISMLDEVFKNNLYNGVIIVGASDKDVEYINDIECVMPIVFFNRENEKYSTVCVNNYKIGSTVADLLHARNHKSVGIIESDLTVQRFSLRALGFLETCNSYGMDVFNVQSTLSETDSLVATKELFDKSGSISAIFVAHGTIIPGVYKFLEDNNIKIPEDIELIAYGDTHINKLIKPSLTVLDLPVNKMVRSCIDLIEEINSGKIMEKTTNYTDCVFVFRESCGAFPEQN